MKSVRSDHHGIRGQYMPLRGLISGPGSSEASKGLHLDHTSRPRKNHYKEMEIGKRTDGHKRKLTGS